MSMRVTGMTLILVSIIFFACYIVVVIQYESVKSWGKEAYILWLLFFSNINVIQLLCINLAGGSKWCFAIIMLIEVLSISIPILPGSYVMLCRSEKILEGGFRLDICVLVEIFLLLILSMEGYRLLRTGGRKYGQRHTGRKSNKDF